MNMVSGITSRENLNIDSKLNVVWTSPDSQYFTNFIQSLGHNLILFDHVYFGHSNPHIILCNNKISSYESMNDLSIQFHIPILVIDHTIKSELIDSSKVKLLNNFSCCYKICINKNIYDSWGATHDKILSYDIQDENNRSLWQNLIIQVSKKVFLL